MRRWCYLLVVVFCVVVADKAPSCTTPNGETAQCISLFSCPILQEAVASKDASVKRFIEVSGCGHGQFMVCCGTSDNYIDRNTTELGSRNKENDTLAKEAHRDFVIKNLLPSKQLCGMQHTDDYFYNQTVTSVYEFPWMLYIPLKPHDRYPTPRQEIKCSGVLISTRYALTASYCAAQHFTSVKIGQYDKYQNVSCMTTSFGEEDCTEPAIEVAVTERHYTRGSALLLLRLAETVTYTDYIRAICLPLEQSGRPQIGDTVVTSGWGEADFEGKHIKEKKRVKHTVVADVQT